MAQKLKESDYDCFERIEVLDKMDNVIQIKQTEQQLNEKKKVLIEKINMCHELELEKKIIKEKTEQEMKIRDKLIEELIKDEKIIQQTAEDFKQLQNVVQLCINEHEALNNLKESISIKLNKKKETDNTEDEAVINEFKSLSKYLNNVESQSLKQVKEYEYLIKEIQEELAVKQQNILHSRAEAVKQHEKKEQLETENNILCQEIKMISSTELQNKFISFNEQEQKEINMFENQITVLSSEENKNRIQKMEQELDNIQKEFKNYVNVFNDLTKQKEKSTQSYSDLKLKCVSLEKEIDELYQQYDHENENCNNQIANLKEQLEEIKKKNNVVTEETKLSKQELLQFDNEVNFLNEQICNLDISSNNLKFELKHELDILEENFQKFHDELSSLKQNIEEETEKQNILNNKQEKLNERFQVLVVDYEEVNIQNDKIYGEGQIEEFEINRHVELLKNDMKKIKNQIQIIETNFQNEKSIQNKQLQQLELEFNEKSTELSERYQKMKDEYNERIQIFENQKTDEIQNLSKNEFTLRLQLDEFKVSAQNLDTELKLKVKELEDLTSNKFKKPTYGIKIPKVKIPPSKYSSSDSSIEDIALSKRRKVTFKHRRVSVKKGSSQQSSDLSSQMNNADLFNVIKYGPTTTNKSSRKKSIKKLVF